jgi:DNA-binding transcriptional ArsR family regulator
MTRQTNTVAVDDILRVVAEPRRRDILRLVWSEELSAGEIASKFDVTFGAVSQHLKVLNDAQLVVVRRDGRRRLYRADRAALGPLGEHLMALWGEQLKTLKRLAEDEWNAKKRR